MSEANDITFAQAKTSLFYPTKQIMWYNTLYLAGKIVCKKDEKFLVLFDLFIKLLYDRCANEPLFYVDLGLSERGSSGVVLILFS